MATTWDVYRKGWERSERLKPHVNICDEKRLAAETRLLGQKEGIATFASPCLLSVAPSQITCSHKMQRCVVSFVSLVSVL